jgi:hypothetical protein
MTIGPDPESDLDLEREMAVHLARAGITLPPGRMAEVLREYRALKQQIATVRTACPPDAEPVTAFVMPVPQR